MLVISFLRILIEHHIFPTILYFYLYSQMLLLVLILPQRIVYYLSCHLLFLSLLLFSTSTSIVEVAAAATSNNNLAFVGHVSSSSITSSRTMMNKNSNSINDNKAAAAVEKEEEDNSMNSIVHRFGQFIIPKTNIFCISKGGTIAFVNLRPIVVGHVLVTTQRIVPFVEDLTEEEYIDMWLLVRRVQIILKVAYPKTTAFNIAVQDGQDAGQSIPHVHVHILPRSSMQDGDPFAGEKNDEIYEKLEKWAPTTVLVDEKQEQKQNSQNNLNVPNDNERMDRTEEMMTNEANRYRQLSLSLQK